MSLQKKDQEIVLDALEAYKSSTEDEERKSEINKVYRSTIGTFRNGKKKFNKQSSASGSEANNSNSGGYLQRYKDENKANSNRPNQ